MQSILLFILIIYKSHSAYTAFYPSFFKEEDIGHVPTEDLSKIKRDSNLAVEKSCDEDKLVGYLADIQIINPEHIIKLATQELYPLCRKVSENLDVINNYLKTCKPPSQEDLYISLIEGVKQLSEKMCTGSPFFKRYEKYYPCLHELSGDFEACSGPPDWNENGDKDRICRAYKNIIDCYYIKSAKVCGKEAAATIKELFIAVVNSILTVKCDNIDKDPKVSDPMPEAFINKINQGTKMSNNLFKIIVISVIIKLYL